MRNLTVKNLISTFTILLMIAVLGAASAQASIQVGSADYRPGGTPGGGVLIVDNSSLTRTIALSAPAASTITDVNITIDFTKSAGLIDSAGVPTGGGGVFTFNSEIVFRLTSPQGTVVNLVNSNTYSGQNGSTTQVVTFDDSAASVVGGSTILSGVFQPVGSLADFDGELAAGNYTLFFQDTAGADPLSVNAWSIQVTTNVIPEPTTFIVWSLLGAMGLCRVRRKNRI